MKNLNFGISFGKLDPSNAPPPIALPYIVLSNAQVLENLATGNLVGALSVANSAAAWSFSKLTDLDGKFAVTSPGSLNLAAALDFETKTSHSVTVQATNGTDTLTATFVINVVNVLEGTLAGSGSFTEGAMAGTVIATITGFDLGANEQIASINPNDGRLAVTATQVVVGLSAASPGTINAVVTTTAGRTLALPITVNSAAVIVQRLAHRVYGPGYNSGAAPPTGDGTAKTYASTFRNESGAPISKCSIVGQGWTLRTTGTTDTTVAFSTTWNIEYPVGTVVGTVAFDVQPGANTPSPEVTLNTAIPAGADFRIAGSSTVPNGQAYITNLGFAGLRTHALMSSLRKVAIGGFGDSIMTNNNGALANASLGRCPSYLNSITGTRADTYGNNGGAFFVRQADLVAKLGLTHVLSNFGTNDAAAGVTVAGIQSAVSTMRDMVRAVGAKWVHCTMLPRMLSTAVTTTAISATSSGNFITLTVADASKFIPNVAYTIAGATQSEYNGTKFCTAVNTANNTITLLFQGSATATATGTVTITPWKPSLVPALMQQFSAFFAPGAASPRGQYNAWIRGGAFDGYVDWADACEPFRDAGRWRVAGEGDLLPTSQLITVSSVINTTRINSNYDRGNSTVAAGILQPLTGNNIGQLKGASGNTGGDITFASAFTGAQAVNDQYWVMPGAAYMSDDMTHPRVAAGAKGGQPHLDNSLITWLDQQLAA